MHAWLCFAGCWRTRGLRWAKRRALGSGQSRGAVYAERVTFANDMVMTRTKYQQLQHEERMRKNHDEYLAALLEVRDGLMADR